MQTIDPHLLRDHVIERSKQSWTANIIYVLMVRDFLYLVAFMDRHSLKAQA